MNQIATLRKLKPVFTGVESICLRCANQSEGGLAEVQFWIVEIHIFIAFIFSKQVTFREVRHARK